VTFLFVDEKHRATVQSFIVIGILRCAIEELIL